MGASEQQLIQTVLVGVVTCLIGVIICIAIVRIKIRTRQMPRKERVPEKARRYHITLKNRQNGDEYERDFEGEVIVGRSPEEANLIVYDDRSVSKSHFKIIEQKGEFLIEDLQSSNHTWLNGRRVVGQQPVKTGDRVTIGYYTYSITLKEEI